MFNIVGSGGNNMYVFFLYFPFIWPTHLRPIWFLMAQQSNEWTYPLKRMINKINFVLLAIRHNFIGISKIALEQKTKYLHHTTIKNNSLYQILFHWHGIQPHHSLVNLTIYLYAIIHQLQLEYFVTGMHDGGDDLYFPTPHLNSKNS